MLVIDLELLERWWIEGLLIIIDRRTFDAKRPKQDIDDPKYAKHNDKSDDPPDHVLVAFLTFVGVVGTSDVLEYSPEEDDEGNDEGDLYDRIDDLGIELEQQAVHRLIICLSVRDPHD